MSIHNHITWFSRLLHAIWIKVSSINFPLSFHRMITLKLLNINTDFHQQGFLHNRTEILKYETVFFKLNLRPPYLQVCVYFAITAVKMGKKLFYNKPSRRQTKRWYTQVRYCGKVISTLPIRKLIGLSLFRISLPFQFRRLKWLETSIPDCL